jgi:hypothetical protein
VVDGGAESEVTVDKDVDGWRLSARRASMRSTAHVLFRRRAGEGRSPRVISSPPGENAGEGVDEDGGDALAFERCEERVRVAPR